MGSSTRQGGIRLAIQTHLCQFRLFSLPSAKLSQNLDLIWSTDLQIDRLHHVAISS